jgi:membrane-associated protein
MTPLFGGVTRMKYYRFLPYNLAAGVVWAVTYSLVGYVFGQYWGELLAIAKSLGYGVIGLVALLVLAYVLRRRRFRNKQGH